MHFDVFLGFRHSRMRVREQMQITTGERVWCGNPPGDILFIRHTG